MPGTVLDSAPREVFILVHARKAEDKHRQAVSSRLKFLAGRRVGRG